MRYTHILPIKINYFITLLYIFLINNKMHILDELALKLNFTYFIIDPVQQRNGTVPNYAQNVKEYTLYLQKNDAFNLVFVC